MPIGRGLRRVAWAALMALGAVATPLLVASDASAQATSDRPWLGVAMDGEGQGPQGPGVRVARVVRKSPADLAGIHEGDRLVRVAGTAVQRSADVIRAVAAFAPGDKVDVVLFGQGGKEQTAHVTLAAFPSQDDMMRMDLVGSQAPTWRDVQVVSGVFPPSIGALRGRVVVLDFWATWCTGCKVEIPWFMEFQKKYARQGLATIGAAMDAEGWEKVRPYVVQHPFNYAIVAGDDAFAKLFDVVNLPMTIAIDRQGRIADMHAGMVDKRKWEKQLKALLRE
jgi:thiol-disulfide isomerase/thioredoxin